MILKRFILPKSIPRHITRTTSWKILPCSTDRQLNFGKKSITQDFVSKNFLLLSFHLGMERMNENAVVIRHNAVHGLLISSHLKNRKCGFPFPRQPFLNLSAFYLCVYYLISSSSKCIINLQINKEPDFSQMNISVMLQ